MVRAELGRAGVALVLLVGCGGEDHAGFISQAPGSGGKTGSGGASQFDAGSGGSVTEGAGGGSLGRGGLFGAGGRKTGTGGKRATGGMAVDAGSDGGGTPVTAPPWAITGKLDATDVYYYGLLNYEACNNQVLARVSDFDKYTQGFECSALPIRSMIVRGNLYYEYPTGMALYQFVPDLVDPYPSNAYANDKKVDAPCSGLITGYVMSPSGDLLYHCLYNGWYELGGASVYSGEDEFRAMTDGRLMASVGTAGKGAGVMSLSDGVLHEVPVMADNPWGFRVHGETFHFVVGGMPPQLVSVDASGTVTKLGEFPDGAGGGQRSVLGPDDSLYDSGFDRQMKVGYVSRSTLDGKRENIQTTSMPHTVLIADLNFVTGP